MDNETQEQTVNNRLSLRRAAPIAAAVALGAGAGAGIYAGVNSGSSTAPPTTVVASVPAQTAAATGTTTLTQLYKNAAPGVVDIVVTTGNSGTTSPFDPNGGSSQAEGAGFVYDDQGDIVTN